LGNKYKVPDFQQVTAKNTKISSISRHKNEKNTILVVSCQWAVDSCQWVVASHQPPVVSCQLSVG
jgi:hypothetical protein